MNLFLGLYRPVGDENTFASFLDNYFLVFAPFELADEVGGDSDSGASSIARTGEFSDEFSYWHGFAPELAPEHAQEQWLIYVGFSIAWGGKNKNRWCDGF
ncbi:hypothetical protein HQ544_00890 [Candidatus Falkowbacteria bacterium]|nr:hypothetical protein [Candidatus Falkowbacteria bacterium]